MLCPKRIILTSNSERLSGKDLDAAEDDATGSIVYNGILQPPHSQCCFTIARSIAIYEVESIIFPPHNKLKVL